MDPLTRTEWAADELLAVDFPPMRWAVEGVLAEGVNLLVGAPKFGKSWMALGLATAVASGGRAFGRIAVEPGDVLYLALEDTGRRLQDRLRRVLGTDPAPHRLRLATTWNGVEAVDTWLTKHPACRLVVVDVLHKVRPPMVRGESTYTADYRALEPFAELAGRHRVCVLALHHVRKSTAGDDFVEEVSGTFGLSGSADAILVARRSRNTGAAIVKVTGRDVEERELALQFDPLTGAWTLLDGPASMHDMSEGRAAVIVSITADGPATPSELSTRTGMDRERVKKLLQRMASDGVVVPVGGGRYSLPQPSVPLSPASPRPHVSLIPGDAGTGGTRPPGFEHLEPAEPIDSTELRRRARLGGDDGEAA